MLLSVVVFLLWVSSAEAAMSRSALIYRHTVHDCLGLWAKKHVRQPSPAGATVPRVTRRPRLGDPTPPFAEAHQQTKAAPRMSGFRRLSLRRSHPVLRACIEPGCPNYATTDGTRCDTHRRAKARNKWKHGYTGRRGSRPGWRALRATIIEAQHGRCGACLRFAPLEVHHINEDARDDRRSNLVALCETCHAAR